jgi:hypothetical protein
MNLRVSNFCPFNVMLHSLIASLVHVCMYVCMYVCVRARMRMYAHLATRICHGSYSLFRE